ncbi:hypothetical protein, partial [Rhizobium leguminosarum]|uniref:hypothetical protein n=1 Tax=Rhizobium leguminosarum TaxID=384 RepID=UPI003F97717A
PMNSDNKPENQDPVLGIKRMRRRTITGVAPGPDLAGSLCGDSIPSTLYPQFVCVAKSINIMAHLAFHLLL